MDDDDKWRIYRKAIDILAQNMTFLKPAVTPNPDRRWWQFWKPKTIYVGRPLPKPTTDTIRFRSANRYKIGDE